MTKLLVAEKPSLARELASALGIPLVKNGEIPAGVEACVVALRGHVMTQAEPQAYNPAWKSWNFSVLPMIPEKFIIEPDKDSKDVYSAAAKAITDPAVTRVVNCCDPGREGELIFGLLYEYLAEKKRLKKEPFRMWWKDLTEEELRAAFKTMKPWSEYRDSFEAAKCRQESDWLLGMNATRGQTLAMRAQGAEGVFSIGRVQTPTLAILVNREIEIRTFRPKTFWLVEGLFGPQAGGQYIGKWVPKKGVPERFENEADAGAFVASLQGKPAKVTSCETKDGAKQSEQFYDLNALQKECNKRFRMTAEQTLAVAQSLYEKKVLSYPRTNSRHLTDARAEELPALLQHLKSAWPAYAPFVEEIEALGAAYKKLSKKYVDGSKVDDHDALLPADGKASLTAEEGKVFDLVVRRLLAAFYPDRIEAKTTILTEVEGEAFKTTGTMVKVEGWSKVDPSRTEAKKKKAVKGAKPDEDDDEEGGEEEASELPVVQRGEAVQNKAIKPKRGETKPPNRFDEGDLLDAMAKAGNRVEDEELAEAMKDKGLGTAATRASIIETLVKREFVERQKNKMVPTPKGIKLIQDITIEPLKSPALTGEWEEKLNRMGRGQYPRTKFMGEIHAFVSTIVVTFKGDLKDDQGGGVLFEPVAAGPCPKCKATLMHKAFKGKHYVKCSGAACKVAFDCDKDGVALAGECKSCGGPVNRTKGGSCICVACDTWQDDAGAGGDSSTVGQSMGTCPKCKKGELIHKKFKTDHYVKCNAEGCGVSYGIDPAGKVIGGHCSKCECPVRITKETGSKVCVVCGHWQEERQPPKDAGKCPKCSKGTLMLKSYKGDHYIKCSLEGCDLSYGTDDKGKPLGGYCPTCKGPIRVTKSKSKVCSVCGQFMDKK